MTDSLEDALAERIAARLMPILAPLLRTELRAIVAAMPKHREIPVKAYLSLGEFRQLWGVKYTVAQHAAPDIHGAELVSVGSRSRWKIPRAAAIQYIEACRAKLQDAA